MVHGVLREVQRVRLIIQLRYALSKILPDVPRGVLEAVVDPPVRTDVSDDRQMSEALERGYAALADMQAADAEAKVRGF